MNRKSISRKLGFSSTAPHVHRSLLLLAVLSVGFFCCDVDECQGQVTSADIGTALSTSVTSQNNRFNDSRATNAQFLEYERQLNAMLKTRRDEEKEFVGLVVNQIRLGRIPSKLVSTSFEWVRNKRPTTKYPFVYFERVLRLQAGKLGLANQIPRFDYSVYSQTDQPTSSASNDAGDTPRSDTTASSDRRNGIFRLGNILLDRIRR